MRKIKDLSAKMTMPTAEEELSLSPNQELISQRAGGLSLFSNSFKRGYGDEIFGSDRNGIWLGAADFADAPFNVDMDGQLVAKSTNGKVVIDTPNSRILVYDDDGNARVLIGYQEDGF